MNQQTICKAKQLLRHISPNESPYEILHSNLPEFKHLPFHQRIQLICETAIQIPEHSCTIVTIDDDGHHLISIHINGMFKDVISCDPSITSSTVKMQAFLIELGYIQENWDCSIMVI